VRGRRRRFGSGGLFGGGKGGRATAEVEGTLLALAHPPPPELAKLVIAAEKGVETEPGAVVADPVLADLVDHGVEAAPFRERRELAVPAEEEVVLSLQLPELFFE
jgi:hypothetical protein